MSQSEQHIMQEILIAIGSRPDCRVWRQNSGMLRTMDGKRVVRAGVPGCADISGILRPSGRRLEIEVKTPSGKQSTDQKRFQKMIVESGGAYIVARSVAEAIAALDAISAGP